MIELPDGVIDKMALFGQFEFDSRAPAFRDLNVWVDIAAPFWEASQENAPEFLAELVRQVVPAGGWAVYGGERLVKELWPGGYEDPSYDLMMDAALDFLRSQGCPPMYLNSWEWQRWMSTRGQAEAWLPTRELPARTPLFPTPLRSVEKRLIAQIDSRPESNLMFVRSADHGMVTASVQGPRSDEDPTRTEWDYKSMDSMYDLYVEIGADLQIPPCRCDAELLVFVPYDNPRIRKGP
jgi:hypothetical protein